MERSQFGICRLSIVPVRKEPSHSSEMVTQLLFGDHYTVLSATPDKNWIHIKIYFDEYEGWIDIKQHKEINEAYFFDLIYNEFKISTDITNSILYKKKPLQIVMGSILPISNTELQSYQGIRAQYCLTLKNNLLLMGNQKILDRKEILNLSD